ncbi:hypothetical protein [Caldichromatium japonicum]|uniref:hypothetical protein n=1 Tax=Caldichromatium japonicum TaxID=2699430 RepID=UPI001FE7D905|nr:hypothetical protein [Caldichromatium japonicum]
MDNFPHGKRDDGHRQGGEAAWRLGQDLATLGARRGFDPGGANSREAQIRELIGLRSKVSEPTRIDAHAQPFADLAKAWDRFFADIKAGKKAHALQFKKKGRCHDSFYVANDKFRVSDKTICLPKSGEVAMTEALCFDGKILGATVSRTADAGSSPFRLKWSMLRSISGA